MIVRPERTPGLPPCRVLLVSDRAGATDVLGTHLAHHGFMIVGHEGGPQAARTTAARERPDVVLVDAAVRGGWQGVVAAIDAVPPGRIAVLGAYWSARSRHDAEASGIGATLLKQAEGSELVARLRQLASAPACAPGAAPEGPQALP